MTLPVLEAIRNFVAKSYNIDLKSTVLVCVQHILESTGSLFEALLRLGANPSNIYLLGKFYSTHLPTGRRIVRHLGLNYLNSTIPKSTGNFHSYFKTDILSLWDTVIENEKTKNNHNMIIIDEGGYCIDHIPREVFENYNIIGIEQTTSGLSNWNQKQIPIIDVASSAIKRYIEPPLVSKAIVQKLGTYLEVNGSNRYGIIGVGNIGSSLAKILVEHNFDVYVYDKNPETMFPEGVCKCESLIDLFSSSDVIFGCTGENVLELDFHSIVQGDKVLVSCSSGDNEFLSVLLRSTNTSISRSSNILTIPNTLFYRPGIKSIYKVLNGGYPINFDRTKKSVPSKDIQVTRGLILSAVIQAFQILKYSENATPSNIPLDSNLQQFVFHQWIKLKGTSPNQLESKNLANFENIDWIRNNSLM